PHLHVASRYSLEQPPVIGQRTEVRPPEIGDHATARRALEEAELEQERLVDVFDGLCFLTERNRKRREPDGPAAELLHDGAKQLAVEAFEPCAVHLEQRQR